MLKESIIIKSRTRYSIQHIQSAAYFARLSADIEKTKGGISNDLLNDYQSCVTASIFASVSFLEATINEVFADTVDNPPDSCVKQLNQSIIKTIAKVWNTLEIKKLPNFSMSKKFQFFLTLAEKEPFDTGRPPFQDVSLLVYFRNTLVHYEPEWIMFGTDPTEIKPSEIEKKLRGKFKLNPLTKGGPFFPNKCLSYGCASWAVNSSIKFADEFYKKIGATPSYVHVSSRLQTK